MKTEQPILITSLLCKESGGVMKNRFIDFNGSYCSDTVKSFGVCNADTNNLEMIPITAKGIAVVITGGAIPQGSPVQAFDEGVAVLKSSGPLEGYAVDASSGSGQLIRILLS